MIRVIVFDLGNVIVGFDNHIITRKFEALSGRNEAEVFNAIYHDPLIGAFDRGEIQPWDFFESLKRKFNLPLTYEQFVPLWCEIFNPVPGMEQLVRSLKGRYKTALLSNTNELHADYICRTFPAVMELFDDIHLSCRLGLLKPDPAIFRKVIDFYGFPADELVFIDDIETHVRAAESLGIRSILFKSAPQLEAALRDLGISAEETHDVQGI